MGLVYIVAGMLFVAAAVQISPSGPARNAVILVGAGLILIAVANRFLAGPQPLAARIAWPLLVCWAGGAAFIIAGLTEVTPAGPARQFVLYSTIGVALLLLGWRFFSQQAFVSGLTPKDESPQQRDTRWTRNTVLTFAAVGTAGVVLYSIRYIVPAGPVEGMFRVLGAGTLIGCGSLLTGALFGFLFGIPRAQDRRDETRNNKDQSSPAGGTPSVTGAPGAGNTAATTSPAGPGAGPPSLLYRVNTNLEEISDWLTKIIVGLGLIELKEFPAYLRDLAGYFGASLGDVPGRDSVALALILLFLVCGFLLGYLLTRLFLTGALARAEAPETLQLRAALNTASIVGTGDGGTPEAKKAVIEQIDFAAAQVPADQVKQEVLKLAREYDSTRASMSPSRKRTRLLDGIVLRMQGLARRAGWILPNLVKSTSDGEKLAAIALLQMDPDPEYLSWLAGLFHEATPFLMYHAAEALRSAVRALKDQERDALKSALEEAKKETWEKFPDPDKEKNIKNILDQALQELEPKAP